MGGRLTALQMLCLRRSHFGSTSSSWSLLSFCKAGSPSFSVWADDRNVTGQFAQVEREGGLTGSDNSAFLLGDCNSYVAIGDGRRLDGSLSLTQSSARAPGPCCE